MASAASDTPDSPAGHPTWRWLRRELTVVALYASGYALGRFGVMLVRLLASPAADP